MAGRKTVLIVDDSQAVHDTLGAAFGEAGYDVKVAGDAEAVFREMAEAAPEALLLDIYMPKVNGTDVCRLVKAHPLWKKTFLVLTSSRLDDREIEMYRRIGANEILKKPLDPDHVVALVEKGLQA